MRPSVERDFGWQHQFIPALKRVVAEHLIIEASPGDDAHRNTDLVLAAAGFRIACRVRRHSQHALYGHEFTLRSSRASGNETELSKVLAGWGDYILYAFAEPVGNHLYSYVLGDLNVFRAWHAYMVREQRRPPGTEKTNRDGRSTLRAYCVEELPVTFVIGRATRTATRGAAA